MNTKIILFSTVWTSLFLFACGEDTTPFKETELGRFNIQVSKGESGNAEDPAGSYAIPEDEGTTDGAQVNEVVAMAAAAMENDEGSTSDDAVSESKGKGESKEKASSSDKSKSDEETVKACGKAFAGKAKAMRVISSEENGANLVIDESTVLAARVSGNKSQLNLNIAGVERIAGICIFATGNQPRITINSSVTVGQLVYAAAGNQSKGKITLQEEAKLESSVIVLKGNQQDLELVGVDGSHCAAASLSGHDSVCH